jgi:sulfoxide reductase catalytic subunit YedY
MLIRKTSEIPSSQITSKADYDAYQTDRRQFLAKMGLVGAGIAASAAFPRTMRAENKLQAKPTAYSVPYPITPEAKAKSYNNFYEFGTDKSDPARNAHTLRVRPWHVKIDGLVPKKQTVDIDSLTYYRPLEERVYRFRCVEAWSMVIPWVGYSLSELIKFANPLPSAKYLVFNSLDDPSQEPEIGDSGINPPYQEGLRMDEAMNPLTLLTFGSYGETLANQQGAPVRVIVPWKYGFKSAKSIVSIKFVSKEPSTTWNDLNPQAYGFYSNVNPNVSPWISQAHERLLDSNSIFPRTVPTLMFNGYEDQVASMYAGMDLRKDY